MEYSPSTIRCGTYVSAYFALWAAVLMLLRTFDRFEASEALAALVILGVIFPVLAMLATYRLSALPHVVLRLTIETMALLTYLVVIAWVQVSEFSQAGQGRNVSVF